MQIEKEHIFIGLILLVFVYLLTSKKEGYNNFCGNCHDLTKEQCAKCPNCGVCGTDGGCESCAQGDHAGPYFKDKCVNWTYMGKTPNHRCWNYDKNSPYNCGYYFPYNKRAVNHIEFAAMHKQLGTGPKA